MTVVQLDVRIHARADVTPRHALPPPPPDAEPELIEIPAWVSDDRMSEPDAPPTWRPPSRET
jgi:hypothetical protein